MTKLQIISKLWSIIYDLFLFEKGESNKTLEEIEKEMDVVEYNCRRYADAEDDELPEKIRAEPPNRVIFIMRIEKRGK